ncbi:M57 family metalloprotease [Pedobacter sp. SG908]|uniref:M57 family metalloprotease n=1 Tax=Pedobacter sp. SG908 TaxID=2587135 RepID=UPI00141DD81C|nr:M57 family metalloprotease [Pedobacter sp. SG908]NII84946.1 hypothetical protein [Pedobacter sp. SG908]
MKKVSIKNLFYFVATMGAAFVMTTTGCKKNEKSMADSEINTAALGDVSLDKVIKDLKTIRAIGFDPISAKIVADGYIVEGDVHLSRKSLDGFGTQPARQEQYSTQYKIATSGVRTINLALTNSGSAGNLNTAFDNTVKDLNNLKLPSLKFVRVTDVTKADITVAFKDLGGADASGNVTLGQDGSFVNPDGNPGSDISLNSNPDAGIASASVSFLQSVLDHEFGHAIGLRHTDYRDRLYGQLKSSNGSNPSAATQDATLTSLTKQLVDDQYGAGTWNRQSASSKASLKAQVFAAYFDEGDGSSSDYSLATHIYGTPLTPTYTNNTWTTATDPLSIMISFANSSNLTYSAYDNIALLGLYGSANQQALIKSYLTSTGTVTSAANAKGITTVAQVVTAVKAAI